MTKIAVRLTDSRALTELARDAARGLRARPVVPHSAERRVSRESVGWARDFGLVSNDLEAARASAIRCGSCAAHAYPSAPEPVVRLAADLITWLFLFDDRVGEGSEESALPAIFDSCDRVVRTRSADPDATVFHHALADLATRAHALGNDAWLDRFAIALGRYFAGCATERPHRRAGMSPSLEEYRRVRSLTVGMHPVFALIELGGGILSAEEDLALEPARTSAALLCAWVNDIYSYPKESAAGDPLNLVAVLAREYRLTPQQALRAAVDVFELDLVEFEQRAGIFPTSSSALRNYLAGLEDWIAGNVAWTGLCGRYR